MKNILLCLLIWLPSLLIAQKESYQQNVELAKKKLDAKMYEEAITYIDKAILKKPKVAENYYIKGVCYLKQGKYKESIEQLDIAIAKNDKNWLYFKSRGDSYYNSENYEMSLKDYIKSIELHKTKTNDTLFWYRGDAYRKLNRYQEAIQDYDKAILLNDKNPEVFFHRAYMKALLKDTTNACQDYQKAYEMGVLVAKKEAYNLVKCRWAAPTIEKDNSPVPISKVEVEPFTGAVIVSKGLKYKKCEFIPEKESGFITNAVFGFDESFVFCVEKPRGFKENENGKIFFGASFAIYENGTEVGGVKDLFADNYEGVDSEMLSNLRIKLSFNNLLKTEKQYTLKVRFFDKRSNAEISMEMPFVMAKNTSKSNIINLTQSILALGAESRATNEIEIGKVKLWDTGKAVSSLQPGRQYQLQLADIKRVAENLNLQYAWVLEKDGSCLKREKLMVKRNKNDKNSLSININSPQQAGSYIFWLHLSDKENPAHIWAMSYPIKVN